MTNTEHVNETDDENTNLLHAIAKVAAKKSIKIVPIDGTFRSGDRIVVSLPRELYDKLVLLLNEDRE